MERRDLFRYAAIGAVLASAQTLSACEYAQFDDDDLGTKLLSYFRSGSSTELNDLFGDFTTLVAFSSEFIGPGQIKFEGKEHVTRALSVFRDNMTGVDTSLPLQFLDGRLVGNRQQGRMNRIELTFGQAEEVDTSCGPTNFARRVDVYYQAATFETDDRAVGWAVERLAIMPPLEMDRFNG